MMMRRASLILLFVAATAGGCSRADVAREVKPDPAAPDATGPPASPDPGPVKITFQAPPALCQVGWVVAREKGFFTAEGLDVQFLPTDVSTSHEHAPTWLVGPSGVIRADAAVIEYGQLPDMASGRLGYYVIAGEHSGCRQLVVPVQSSIRTVSDLNGKRVGVSFMEATDMWEYLAQQAGLARGALRWVRLPVPLGGPKQLESVKQEFTAGRLDAYVTADPVGEILKEDGVARHIASNTWTPPLKGWYCCMLGVRREVLDANPTLAGRLIRAIRRASAFVEREPAEAVSVSIERGYLPRDTRRDLSVRLLREYVWTATGRIEEDLERYFQLLIEGGRLPATPSPRELVKRVYRSGE